MLTRLGIRAAQLAWSALIAVLSFMMFQGPAATSPDGPVSAGDLTISDHAQYENLTVFLIHGKDRVKSNCLLTLQEALEQHKAVVREIAQVNTLEVENISADTEVFIQSGDIVKGGKQDRLITFDLLLPPKSGKLSVASCCVEQGRWQQRGKEAVARFTSSQAQVPSKMLKVYGGNYNGFNNIGGFNLGANGSNAGNNGNLGGNFGGNLGGFNLNNGYNIGGGNLNNGQVSGQQGVWQEVGEVQKKLQARLRAEVKSQVSTSSLQLTLEHPKVQEAIEKYTRQLSGIIGEQKDVIGYAFAINGHVNSVELYGNAELFQKLWPKLLKANALEAFIEQEDGKPVARVCATDVKGVLLDAERGKAFENDISNRIRVILRETNKNVLFETRDRERDTWIHKSYLTK